MSGAPTRWNDRFTTLTNLLVVCFLAFVLLSEWGPWQTGEVMSSAGEVAPETITAIWPQLADGSDEHGSLGSDAVIVEFSDYTCPFCREAYPLLGRLADELGIRVVFRHLPRAGPGSLAGAAARASTCAGEQGRFREMHHALLSRSDWEQDRDWDALASAADVPDRVRFLDCIDDPATDARILAGLALARILQISGTPAFVGPGGVHLGIPTRTALEGILAAHN